MPDTSPTTAAKPAKKGGRGRALVVVLAAVTLLGGGAAGAYFLVPGAQEIVAGLLPPRQPAAPPAAQTGFIDLPELTITLTNGGRPRQLKLSLSIEITGDPAAVRPQLLTPRLSDSLVTYLRTLRDGELEGALAVDRLRSDLYRRIELVVGPGVLRDVLVTGLLVS